MRPTGPASSGCSSPAVPGESLNWKTRPTIDASAGARIADTSQQRGTPVLGGGGTVSLPSPSRGHGLEMSYISEVVLPAGVSSSRSRSPQAHPRVFPHRLGGFELVEGRPRVMSVVAPQPWA